MTRPARIGVVLLVALGVALTAPPSRPAFADKDDQKAAEHFQLAEAAEARGDWQTAILEYKRAYALKPHPFTLFNIATNYERLGDWENAADYFQRYLDAEPGADDRAEVEQRIATLRAKARKARPGGGAGQGVGRLVVYANVDGATVLLDGKPIGKTPLSIDVPAGEHVVEIQAPGHGPARREIAIPAGGSEEVREFLPPTGDGGGAGAGDALKKPRFGIGYALGASLTGTSSTRTSFQVDVRLADRVDLGALFGVLGPNDSGAGAQVRLLLMRGTLRPYARGAVTIGNASAGGTDYRTFGVEGGGGLLLAINYGQKVGATPAARRLAIEIFGEVNARYTAGGVPDDPMSSVDHTEAFLLSIDFTWIIRF